MANSINRRSWIKSSALMAGGLAFISGTMNKLAAMPVIKKMMPSAHLTDKEAVKQAVPVLKARLLANENPFGPSPAAKKAIQDAIEMGYQYPMATMDILIAKIAAFEGLQPANISMNSGSSPLLLAAALFYSKGGKSIITGDPSYEDLPTHAQEFDGKWVKVPVTPDYKLDLDAMEAKIDDNTGLVYICNPNNPTGTVLDTEKLKAFCERVSKKVTVFIDEAYIDYLPDPQGTTLISGVKAGQNIIVARTFSKLYGFAGLRCGYIVAQPETIKALSIFTDSFNLSATTIAGAIAGYQETGYMQEAFKKTMASKEYLYSVLKKEGYTYIPSATNFVLFPIKMDGKQFVTEMMKRGVGLRSWRVNGQDNWCRISIGRMDEMEAFADAFKEIS
jgi:histidinol-phosphate aminotransferase